MRRGLSIITMLAAAASTGALADATLLTDVDLREQAGEFTLFVPPDYPKAALAQGRKAVVDVFGTVQSDGSLDIDRVEAPAGDEEFVHEVRDVAKFWMLRPGYRKCEPIPAKAQMRVWFEVREGQPVVSFSQAKAVADPGVVEGNRKKIRWSRRPKIEYPTSAIRRDVEGTLEVLVRVLPDGTVDQISYVPGPLVAVFGEAIRKGFRRVQFEPLPTEYKEPACASYQIVFRITNIPSR